jgi:thiol-disulfide isomerase/thioredoxin
LLPVLLIVVAVSVPIVWLALFQQPGASASPLMGKVAPDFERPLLNGGMFDLKGQRGEHVVLLDFWATWCRPCVAEMPILAKVADEYRDRGVVLYCVNQGESAGAIRDVLSSTQLDVTVCLDMDFAAGRAFGAKSIPLLVVIDKAGMVRSVHVGYRADIETLLRRELDAILTE